MNEKKNNAILTGEYLMLSESILNNVSILSSRETKSVMAEITVK